MMGWAGKSGEEVWCVGSLTLWSGLVWRGRRPDRLLARVPPRYLGYLDPGGVREGTTGTREMAAHLSYLSLGTCLQHPTMDW
jgi:hypothetical protein